jgi:hypothetical protein
MEAKKRSDAVGSRRERQAASAMISGSSTETVLSAAAPLIAVTNVRMSDYAPQLSYQTRSA